MHSIKTMFKSPRFLIGFILVLTVILYAVFYPMVNTGDPKQNRKSNPDYAMTAKLDGLLAANDYQGAMDEIDELATRGDEKLQETLVSVKLKMQTSSVEKALSGVKQVKGSKFPLKDELLALRGILTLSDAPTEAEIQTAVDAGYQELDRLEAHNAQVVIAAESVKANGAAAIETIAQGDIMAEFQAIAEEQDLAGACDALTANHQAHDEWFATIRQRLSGESVEYKDAKKILNEAVPQSFLIDKDQPPQQGIPLGTDMFSRDILLEMAYGARVSLLVGLIAGVVATIIGLVVGLLAGYLGGFLDNALSTLTNLFLVIPSFVILILIAVALGQIREAWVTGLVIGLTAWPWTAKAVRAQTTSLRYRDHVNMARITGYSTKRIIITEIMPYIASYVVMAFILQVASGIMSEATLAILGLGDPTAISLGRMISWAQQYESIVNGRWWQFVPVAVCIAMITFGLYMMNSGMDQVFNPKIRS